MNSNPLVTLSARHKTKIVVQIAVALVLLMLVSRAFGFSILSIEANRDSDNSVVVTMDCEIELSQDVIEALHSNIPITIATNIKIYRVRDNIWDKLIDEYESQDEIAYRSLYRAYRLASPVPGISANFLSLGRVLKAMCEQRAHRIVLDNAQFDANEKYHGRAKIALDRSTLPSVMRLPVFFKNAWHLQSDRVQFDIQ